MTRTDFLETVISNLFESFPNLSDCLFSYDELSDTNFICVADRVVFNSDDFIKFSADTALKYYEYGFDGTIAIISSIEGLEYLSFETKRNTYLLKQELIDLFLLQTARKNTWVNAPVISTTAFATYMLDMNHIPNSFFEITNDLLKTDKIITSAANDFLVYYSGIIENSLLKNSKSFVIEPEEDLYIALAA